MLSDAIRCRSDSLSPEPCIIDHGGEESLSDARPTGVSGRVGCHPKDATPAMMHEFDSVSPAPRAPSGMRQSRYASADSRTR